ncbi:RdgB/HAM1 family non-canonical purine NTP pyrophosphatase [Candidatus Nitrosopumilus sp. SW]|uniref:RdgB/HAM1 family non-canonical purine NTP pyrophosphatase n=1 Tax=Candidatus Nitrosopumilus sp. SW TaxID=2508726 RepID=UPI0011518061|nr:RdgB/HAM1 family non-canonical purine NTP pyrophosphatase [Candidatus Nitrosopumilus sp. SW]QDI89154.1 RdgB/HAM1 family non-canonical purine NTP pyrophosphatase [Candidatus Nitrosopumilus sp. SW]
MHKLFDLYFVSSNPHKYKEAKNILDSFGIKLGFLKLDLEEIQSTSLKDIAEKKAKDAFSKSKKPIIIEDDGLFIDSLNGFPGPYSSYVFKTIGNKGILKLVSSKRKAKFVSIITYCDKKTLESFDAKLDGIISKSQKGKGWGYDPIFIPKNSRKTFAEIENKNKLSHRFKALKKFSNWYLHKLESSGR